MKLLLIADVHANLPAFQAVLNDVGKADEIIFVGDVVGYGPHLKRKLTFGNGKDIE